ncbi:hypothetical protein MTO96_033578 [Rhipicephalus appendiculatus]
MAAQLAPAETGEDIVCANVVQNIFVEVNSYLAAPDNTCKGIVRGVDLDFDDNQLRDMIVQPRNPKALEVKRIKDTTRIIVLFDGLKVLNYVMCGASMLRCTVYRRQTDVCCACGRLGHRADVCPAPENTICRGCGTKSPAEDHECSPKCALCGGTSSHCRQDLQATLPSALRRPPQEEAAETRHRNTCDAGGVQPTVHLPSS